MTFYKSLVIFLQSFGKQVQWKRVLRLYLIFAVFHVLYKTLKETLRVRRIQKALKHVPGYNLNLLRTDLLPHIHRLHHHIQEKIEKFKGAPLVRDSNPECELYCTTPETVQFILKDAFKSVTKPANEDDFLFTLIRWFIGDEGIFTLRHGDSVPDEDKVWYDQRKTASKLFTKSNFNNLMLEVFSYKADSLCNVLQPLAEHNAKIQSNDKTKGAQVLNIQEKFFCYTFDSIQKIFFNRDVNSVEFKEDPYACAFDGAHRAMLKFMFSAVKWNVSTTYLLPYPFGALYKGARSWWNNPMFTLWSPFHPDYQDFIRNIKYLDQETYRFIARARNPENLDTRQDLLSKFVEHNPEASDKRFRDMTLNFILAGRDTTACTLTWLFYELTQNPQVQQKLVEEIDRVLGSRGPQLDDFLPENMPYLHGVIMETLRLHPPVPEDLKSTSEELVFPDGTVVPAGVRLVYAPYVMGRDSSVYKDPESFNPERWIPFKQPTMFEFPVFQAGNRFCLGKDMAIFESKLVTVRLCQKFEFALESNEKPENITYALALTMSLCNSLDQQSHDLLVVPRLRKSSVTN